MTAAPKLDDDANRLRWRAFAISVAASAISILDISKINVALPSLEHALDAGPGLLQLLVAGYALTLGLTLIPSGRMGDITSRSRLFMIGIAMFLLTSLLCALAPDITILLIGRLLQGVAAGMLMPQVIGIIQQLFHGHERAVALGTFGAIVGISTAFGPALGGFLLGLGSEIDSWRLIFWMNIPLAAIILIFAPRYLPKTQQKPTTKATMDPVGVILLALAIFALMVPFVLTTGRPDDDPKRWFWLFAFAALAALFALWELRYFRQGKTPVVSFRLFNFSSFRNGVIVGFFYFGVMPPLFLLSTLYLQNGLGVSPLEAGLVSAPFALASAFTSWYSGRLVYKIGRKLVVYGLILFAIGVTLALFAAIYSPVDYTVVLMASSLLIGGFGSGMIITPNQTLMLDDIPVYEGGLAGSIGQVGQRIGTAIGVAIAISTFYSTIYAEEHLVNKLEVYHDAYRNAVLVIFSFVAVALLFSFVDIVQGRGKKRGLTGPIPLP
ncbi:MAG: MFS transporter [Microbacteriaceae bacterium]